MESIKLVKENFDYLPMGMNDPNIDKFNKQFVSNSDCPIARALKADGYTDVIVNPKKALAFKDGVYNTFKLKASNIDVIAASVSILNGAEYGEIEIVK